MTTILRWPAEVRLVVATLGWTIGLPLLKRLVPLPRLVRLMWSPPRRALRVPEDRVAGIVARIGRLSRGNCLDRSLILYRFLSRVGADPILVVGFGKEADVVGHTWVTIGDRTLLEDGASLAPYTAFVAFGVGGARTSRV